MRVEVGVSDVPDVKQAATTACDMSPEESAPLLRGGGASLSPGPRWADPLKEKKRKS